MKTGLGRAALAAMLTLGGARANAQITTVVASPKRSEANQQAVVRREQAAQDSVARVTLTGMTQWVDSAAASLAIRPDTGSAPATSGAAAARPVEGGKPMVTAAPQPSAQPPARTPEFRDGARAPDTATAIPTIAITGGIMLLIGFALRRQPRPSTVRRR